jgi:hypothetical protein
LVFGVPHAEVTMRWAVRSLFLDISVVYEEQSPVKGFDVAV